MKDESERYKTTTCKALESGDHIPGIVPVAELFQLGTLISQVVGEYGLYPHDSIFAIPIGRNFC